jgi:hypothetical protein
VSQVSDPTVNFSYGRKIIVERGVFKVHPFCRLEGVVVKGVTLWNTTLPAATSWTGWGRGERE